MTQTARDLVFVIYPAALAGLGVAIVALRRRTSALRRRITALERAIREADETT